MFSTQATFNLGAFLVIRSAKRLDAGKYEIKGQDVYQPTKVRTYIVDARQAIDDMLAVDCAGEFDCERSSKFKSTIVVKER